LIVPQAFYARPTLEVARDLLGKVLVHRSAAGTSAGMIVEVEAYVGEADPACHAAVGPTARNQPLYGRPGHAYVYVNYGLHYLVNAVTEPEGSPAAVLLRALAPLEGVELMQARRAALRWRAGKSPVPEVALCRGPGNLAAAMGIDLALNTRPLFRRPLTIEDRRLDPGAIAWGPRIGITRGTEHHWRAWVAGHPSVSGRGARS
jgi:DNA-3-methyladenine glycosylase